MASVIVSSKWRAMLKPEEEVELQGYLHQLAVAQAGVVKLRNRANNRIYEPRKRERERKKREERAALPPPEVYG